MSMAYRWREVPFDESGLRRIPAAMGVFTMIGPRGSVRYVNWTKDLAESVRRLRADPPFRTARVRFKRYDSAAEARREAERILWEWEPPHNWYTLEH